MKTDSNVSIEQQLEIYLHQHIPLSKSMGIKAEFASPEKVILSAPFSLNINHKQTIFGGSLHAVATLACWSLLHLNLENQLPQHTQIVITESKIIYHAPVNSDFNAACFIPEIEVWERFIKILRAKGKSRIHLSVDIYQHDQLCVSYQGTFAAIKSQME